MIPTKSLFIAGNKWGETPTEFDFEKVKDAFIEAGATDVVDTEDTNGGFTCNLGIPVKVINKSTKGSIRILFGPNDDFELANKTSGSTLEVQVGAIEVIKGSSANALIIKPHTRMNYVKAIIVFDKIKNWVYALHTYYSSSAIYKLGAFKYEDGTFASDLKTTSLSSGGIPGNITTINGTDKAILNKYTWLNEQLESAPCLYTPSLYQEAPNRGLIAEIDSKYYISLYECYTNTISVGSIVCLLGE